MLLYRLPVAPFATLSLALILSWTAPPPVRAGDHAPYRLDMLTAEQKALLLQRIDRYALVESFLAACGRPPELERRVRAIVRGCVERRAIELVANHFRRSLAARATARWNCESEETRRRIRLSEETLKQALADLKRACQPPES